MAGGSRGDEKGGGDPGYSFDAAATRALAEGLDAEHIVVIECPMCKRWVVLPENASTCMSCGYYLDDEEREKAISLAEYWTRQLDGNILWGGAEC